jgi:pimeloyl-ACP methyl ester carboxylesterase
MQRAEKTLTVLSGAALAATAALVIALGRSRPQPPRDAAPEPPAGLPPGRLVRVPGRGEMFLRDTGDDDVEAPTILLLHGWMVPADPNWFTVYEPMAEVGRVLAVDHRGHGYGLRPSTPFRLTDVADDVAALLRHLGTGPVVAVGYSMGGPVAQLLWQRHPDVVAGLVLCATSAAFNVRLYDRWVWRTMGALQVLLRLLPRHWWERTLEAQLHGRLPIRVSRIIHEDTPQEIRELLPWIVGHLDRGSAEDVAEAGRELGRYDARGWIGSVDVPTAVLITAKDALVPARNQRDMAARIDGAVVEELPFDHDAVGANASVFVPALVKAVRQVLDAAAR